MQRMQNEMNRIFRDFRSQSGNLPGVDNLMQGFAFSPSVDVHEHKDRLVVTVDIPGSDESNINVKLQDNRLTISADTKKLRENPTIDQDSHMLKRERFAGRFERIITLPSPVDADKMVTDYKDGVLTITIPKKPG